MSSLFSKICSELPKIAPKLAHFPVLVAPDMVLEKVAELAINHTLKEPLADEELDFLEGKWLEISVTDWQKSWFFTLENNQIKATVLPQHADVCISGEMNSFVLMSAQTVDPDTLFFRRMLLIEGDTELGLEIKNLLDTVEFDTLPSLVKTPLSQYAQLVTAQ